MMTDKVLIDRSVLRKALAALIEIDREDENRDFLHESECEMLAHSITALNEALAAPQPEQQSGGNTPDWTQIGKIVEAAAHAAAGRYVAGTTNWAAAVSRYMLAQAPQPAQPVGVVATPPYLNAVGSAYVVKILVTKHVECRVGDMLYTQPPAQQSLMDEQIDAITKAQWGDMWGHPLAAHRAYARAIEKAHGITGNNK